jgi:protein pelota
MKVIYKDPKGHELKLKAENLDDLWHLHNVIEKGDRVYAWTHRTIASAASGDKLRAEKAEKKKMYLGIEVQDTEFHEFSDRLRIKGVIREGEQDLGDFHTLNIEEGDDVKISKPDWTEGQIAIIKKAIDASGTPIVVFLSIEDDEALIAILRQSGVQQIATIFGQKIGKDYEQKTSTSAAAEEYFKEIIPALERVKGENSLIIVGAGFTKDAFWKFAKEYRPQILEKASIEPTGHGGLTGIFEALKRGAVDRVAKEHRISYETQIVEKLLTEVAKPDGLAVYGPNEVEDALNTGAVEVLLITDMFSRQKKAETLIRLAQQTQAKYVIVGTLHEAGKKLNGLGGVAGILRYKI